METVGTVIYIAIAVVALYGALRGAMKGLYKSLIDLGVTIAVAFLSVWIAKTVSKTLVNEESLIQFFDWVALKIPDFAQTIGSVKEIIVDFSSDTNVVGMALSLPAVILSPIVFMILFLLIGIIIKIPKMILTRCIFGKNSGETYHGGSRIIGAAVGAVARALSLAVFMIPLVGYLNLTNDTLLSIGQSGQAQVEYIEQAESEELTDGEQSSDAASTLSEINSLCADLRTAYIVPIADNFAIKTIHTCGGKWIFKTLSSAKVDDVEVSLTNEIGVLTSVYKSVGPLLEAPIAEYGETQSNAITNIMATLDDATVIPSILSGFLSHTSQAWLDGKAVFGFEKVNVGEYYEPTLDEILTLLSSTTEDTIKQDIHTIGNIFTICIDENVFKEILGGGEAINVAKNEEFLGKIFAEIYINHLTRPLTENMVNALKNYIYRVYNDVNGTSVPYPEQLVMDNLSAEKMYDEGALFASIVDDFMKFYQSFDMNELDNTKLLIQTDLRSLGRGLDKLKRSIIIGDSYNFIIRAILKSEGASQLQFLTPEFIELLTNTSTSMEIVLVSRQQIAIILSATNTEDRGDAIKHILENVDKETAAVIMETLSPDILWNFGMSVDKSNIMSGTINSLIGEIASNEREFTEEELQAEIDAVDKLVTTVQSAANNKGASSNLFSTEDGTESMTGMTSTEIVETVVGSNIVSSAIKSATVDENGNAIEDPYKISNKLSENDKTSAKQAIESYYSENAKSDADNTELEKTLSSLASVFGVEITLSK